MSAIAENFSRIKKAIHSKAELIAVSKNQSEGNIRAALDAGHRSFGENRVQEATARWKDRRKDYADLELHMIGPLQTNKVKEAVVLFDAIQTLDRESLVDALAKEEARQNRRLEYFIQVNTGDEAQKAGIGIENFPALFHYVKSKNLGVTGLMCIPPVADDPRRHFRILKQLGADHGLAKLSMGMSGDFEIAIEEGATHVRIGSALFGERRSQEL